MNGRVFMILVMHMMKVDFNSTRECGCKFEIFDRLSLRSQNQKLRSFESRSTSNYSNSYKSAWGEPLPIDYVGGDCRPT